MVSRSEARKLLWQTPEYREKQRITRETPGFKEKHSQNFSKAAIKRWKTPEYRENQRIAREAPGVKENRKKVMGEVTKRPEYREKQSEITIKRYETPGEKEKTTIAIKRVRGTKESRDKTSRQTTKQWADPAFREKVIPKLIESANDPIVNQKRSASLKATLAIPEVKKRYKTISSDRWADPAYYIRMVNFWYGDIDRTPYCELYDEPFKDRCRGSYGYYCPLCGTPQNGNKLDTHHVDWNKKTCCDGSRRYILPLCHSCHSMVNGGKKKSWNIWRDELVKMIESYYGHWAAEGRSFLTEEEWDLLKDAPFIPPETRYTIQITEPIYS